MYPVGVILPQLCTPWVWHGRAVAEQLAALVEGKESKLIDEAKVTVSAAEAAASDLVARAIDTAKQEKKSRSEQEPKTEAKL